LKANARNGKGGAKAVLAVRIRVSHHQLRSVREEITPREGATLEGEGKCGSVGLYGTISLLQSTCGKYSQLNEAGRGKLRGVGDTQGRDFGRGICTFFNYSHRSRSKETTTHETSEGRAAIPGHSKGGRRVGYFELIKGVLGTLVAEKLKKGKKAQGEQRLGRFRKTEDQQKRLGFLST